MERQCWRGDIIKDMLGRVRNEIEQFKGGGIKYLFENP